MDSAVRTVPFRSTVPARYVADQEGVANPPRRRLGWRGRAWRRPANGPDLFSPRRRILLLLEAGTMQICRKLGES